ncbi:acyl-CoA dehydrogenase family protein [Burkholderia cenocepacia]|uniref:acyl-CoA dehydrogenase family protein n=1 Tax=Burkholderia cenocepacia TaxID=95486 RepID=UPI0028595F48|nr:acyl-CoA dehydrogenase family protein [Burkholderia cenocepacia]MDR8104998.1 acyl-CoA dehydrogenase family protein [Burkholderia cenocepacia]
MNTAEALPVAEIGTIDVDSLMAAAANIVPFLRETARDTEKARRVSDEAIDRLREAGLLSIMVPRRFGGLECDVPTMARLIGEIARGCGSTAWVYGVSVSQCWVVSAFSERVQKEIWAESPDVVISGTYGINPSAQKVVRVEGGYRLTGRWGFASGCDHAGWHLVQFQAPAQSGSQAASQFGLVPRQDFAIEDDWYAMGLAGTGSKTVLLDDVFVPDYRTLPYDVMNSGDTPGAALHGNPIYSIPLMSVTPVGIAATLTGMARGALESLLDGARAGTRDSARGKFADHVLAHAWIGEALADIEAAELVMIDGLEKLTDIAQSGRRLSVDERVKLRRNYAFSVRQCSQAVDRVYKCSGASGIGLQHVAQRVWRDVNSAARHIGLNWEQYSVQSGRNALGLEPMGLY